VHVIFECHLFIQWQTRTALSFHLCQSTILTQQSVSLYNPDVTMPAMIVLGMLN